MAAYDAIVIGTGQAGPSLARRLAARGSRVAVIEQGSFGGTCINTGCTPTKAMVASAYAAHLGRRAGEFGVTIENPVSVEWLRVRMRKDVISGASRASESGIVIFCVESAGYSGQVNCVTSAWRARSQSVCVTRCRGTSATPRSRPRRPSAMRALSSNGTENRHSGARA
jgi:choline dehydrogenase-like flavoprotein